MKKIIILLIATMLIFTGCSKSQDEELDLEAKVADLEKQVEELSAKKEDSINKTNEVSERKGYFKESHYFNEYLEFSFDFPKEWEIQGKEQLEHISEIGNNIIAGDDEDFKEQLEANQDTMMVFNILAYKYPLGTPGKLNPSLTFFGEDVSMYTGILDEDDYIKAIKELYNNSQINIEIIDEWRKTLDGDEFKVLHTTMMSGGNKVEQEMHIRLEKGIAIGIVVTYFDENTKNEVYEVLSSGYNSMN